MNNPWNKINLSDYENHMKLQSVMQLQALNQMMKEQFHDYPIHTVMILGVAGGNGLEHIPADMKKVYGVDLNPAYLTECSKRYENLAGILECIHADLASESLTLPHADMIVADLLIEYIGYRCFQNVLRKVKPFYISCIIQVNTDEGFVSYSPYLHVFDGLQEVHHNIEKTDLITAMEQTGYSLDTQKERSLPNGKKLLRLDFISGCQYLPKKIK